MKITMKRDKEIEKASVEYQMSKNPMALGGDVFEDMVYKANINPSFIAGAKWADKTMIDKACEWLNTHRESGFTGYSGQGACFFNKDKMLDSFRKAMEE